jgi:25S rRNA (adenine2142-N1)-methyltransferase
MKRRSRRRPASLSHGRPPTTKHAQSTALSSKATRNLIRSYHQLLKAHERALKEGDSALADSIEAQIQSNGGLESYQLASRAGQSLERGGDSSKVLVDWIKPKLALLRSSSVKLRVLEVGALSTRNACSQNPSLEVTRIDLHPQEPGILQQDFMERPIPVHDDEKFHLISLSLVLNYVPAAAGRGDMLRRCAPFLTGTLPSDFSLIDFAPCLFLALPAACVINSRYLNEKRLQDVMRSLGFKLLESKMTLKLCFQLWEYDTCAPRTAKHFGKDILNPGVVRNNFSIVIN